MTQRPTPVLRGEERAYFDRARERELVYQRCRTCDATQWYPRVVCIRCSGTDLELTAASGNGTIHSFTTLYRAGHPSRAADVPYTMVLVDLVEGVRVFGELVDVPPAAARIGLPVEVGFQDVTDDLTLPVFRPKGGAIDAR
ncbi:Zn-ribbon domain-containing OB-fold protein [Rhizomonospora bruguierae]|uniref:Zn-ribbon domain-containing OB-fold protein n=1 Tax=Rhizomonospora bruguierae TaxID=1581705 RepID=UPI001BCE5467|nr:OB-fold domain-containing protein [Micromonospora sp. NBRC 107566]